MIKDPWKVPLRNFWYFHFPFIKMSFIENFMKNYHFMKKTTKFLFLFFRTNLRCTVVVSAYSKNSKNEICYISFIQKQQANETESPANFLECSKDHQPPEIFCKKSSSSKFRNIFRKTHLLKSLFNTCKFIKTDSNTGVFL